MKQNSFSNFENRYCIYIETLGQGRIPAVSDGEDRCVVFDTELAAQREIADNAITRLQEFLDGHRDFDEAIGVEELVVPVTLNPDGSFTDEDGNCFNR
jgi:hypothetical protein